MSPDLNRQKVIDAVSVIESGGVALLPTDTVCGLFVSPESKKGIDKIYDIKKRDRSKPLVLLCPDIESVWEIVEKSSDIETILKENWPGAATFILTKKDGDTIGVRMPDLEPLLDLLKKTGPLYATSANISGKPAPVYVDEVEKNIKKKCNIVVDIDVKSSGKPSKVIDLTKKKPKVLRK